MMNTEHNMRRRFLKVATLSAAGAVIGSTQAHATGGQPHGDEERFGETFLPTWQRAQTYTMAFAEAMPEDKYVFRPTPEVRTFSAQLLHLARASSFFASVIGGTEEAIADWEPEGKSKADVITILEHVFAYTGETLQTMTKEQEGATHDLPIGATLTGKELALLMRDHVTHHRGQLVVYLRLNGIEPPQYIGI